jgi:hypothetical protein
MYFSVNLEIEKSCRYMKYNRHKLGKRAVLAVIRSLAATKEEKQ